MSHLFALTAHDVIELRFTRAVGAALEAAAVADPSQLPAALLPAYTPLREHYFAEGNDPLAELRMGRALSHELARHREQLPLAVREAFAQLEVAYADAQAMGVVS